MADFFSFGTNDLTQMTFGFSRDDINTFLPDYLKQELLPRDPFQSLDTTGVGQLVEMGVKKGRSAKKDLKCGICGEHGGDPDSIKFCHKVGLNYVTCSPFRVPIARLAAAQAALASSKQVAKGAVESCVDALPFATSALARHFSPLRRASGRCLRSFLLVADDANRGARRRAAFLDEAARVAAEEEREEFGGRAVGELRLQRVEHFLPGQAAAVDHAVGSLRSMHLAAA